MRCVRGRVSRHNAPSEQNSSWQNSPSFWAQALFETRNRIGSKASPSSPWADEIHSRGEADKFCILEFGDFCRRLARALGPMQSAFMLESAGRGNL
jgi:hypothetical protein